jgi:hemerythrin-like metal-binding protein
VSRIDGPVLGLPELDAPHADLLKRAADLAAAAGARQDGRAATILDGLLEATTLHFAFEDEWMERTSYPARRAHRAAHDLFLQDLHASSREIARAGVTPRIVAWASARLQQWLRYHMEVNDGPLARFLQRAARPPAGLPRHKGS